MNPVEKAMLLRKSLPLKAKRPIKAFSRRLRRPREILRCVEKHETNKGILYEARRQYIVSLCAAYEAYWRDFLKLMIDSHHFTPSQVKKMKYKFTFSDISHIIGNKLTLGELITCSYMFQGTDILNQMCNEVFQFDFFCELEKGRFTIDPAYEKERKSTTLIKVPGANILKHRDSIDKCFQIRHETVHDTGTRYRLSDIALMMHEAAMYTFIVFASLVTEAFFDKMFSGQKS